MKIMVTYPPSLFRIQTNETFHSCTGADRQPLAAQDFSEGSQAKSWNLYAEVPATFEATVVDLLCTLTGNCPDNCGDGSRQLGLLRSVDNVMILPLKNNQAAFTGAAPDLAAYCG